MKPINRFYKALLSVDIPDFQEQIIDEMIYPAGCFKLAYINDIDYFRNNMYYDPYILHIEGEQFTTYINESLTFNFLRFDGVKCVLKGMVLECKKNGLIIQPESFDFI